MRKNPRRRINFGSNIHDWFGTFEILAVGRVRIVRFACIWPRIWHNLCAFSSWILVLVLFCRFFLLFLVFISYFYLSDGDIDVLRPTFVKWMQFLLNLRQPFLSEMRLVVTSTSLHCNNQPCTMVFMWILWATVVVRFFNWNLYVTHWIFLLFNDKKKAAA